MNSESGYKPFRFNYSVAKVFDDMVCRSIPLYYQVQDISAKLILQYYRESTIIYDLGCSTGTSLFHLNKEKKRQKDGRYLRYIGIDKSAEMCKKANDRLRKCNHIDDKMIIEMDLLDMEIKDASVIICHYTLQFLNHDDKLRLTRKLFTGLIPGGLLILSDKIDPDHLSNQKTFQGVYDDFKRCNGYSDEEIIGKRNALKGVLLPLTCHDEYKLLDDAGFVNIEPVVKWFQFVTFMAFRPESQE